MIRGGRVDFCPACRPVFCPCPTSDFDGMEQCRRCGLADLRAPRVAATFALVEAGLPIFPG